LPVTQRVREAIMTDPVEFVVKQLPHDLSSHGGLALVGRLFKRINLPALVDPKYPVRSGIANSDILKCHLGLLTLGKNDFEAVEGFRTQRFLRTKLWACARCLRAPHCASALTPLAAN